MGVRNQPLWVPLPIRNSDLIKKKSSRGIKMTETIQLLLCCLIFRVDCISSHINHKYWLQAFFITLTGKVTQRLGAKVVFRNHMKDKIAWWLAVECDKWTLFYFRMSSNPCFHSVANSSSSKIKALTYVWLHSMKSLELRSVVAVMNSTSIEFCSQMNKWEWMLIERCEEEQEMSCTSEICSLLNGIPIEKELKWSFCDYFQKNGIIIIICENRPINRGRTCSKWFSIISYMFPITINFLDF